MKLGRTPTLIVLATGLAMAVAACGPGVSLWLPSWDDTRCTRERNPSVQAMGRKSVTPGRWALTSAQRMSYGGPDSSEWTQRPGPRPSFIKEP